MIWNIKVWQTCKKIKNQEGGQHFFTPLYICIVSIVLNPENEWIFGYDK